LVLGEETKPQKTGGKLRGGWAGGCRESREGNKRDADSEQGEARGGGRCGKTTTQKT